MTPALLNHVKFRVHVDEAPPPLEAWCVEAERRHCAPNHFTKHKMRRMAESERYVERRAARPKVSA